MIDEAGARQRVEAELARWRQALGYPDVVVDTVTEHRRAWVVSYGTPELMTGRDMRDQLVVATPFVVDKRTGTVRAYSPERSNLYRGWLDDATPEEKRALFEDDATVLVGRRITGVQYWDIHDFGQGKGPWDHGSWHHAVMGVGLDTDDGPVAITWTSRFHPYGIEVFDEPLERHLCLSPEGPEINGPEGPSPWSELMGRVCRAVKVTWWHLELGPVRTLDGTLVAPASVVDVPVAIRLDLDGAPVWFVAAIPTPDGLAGAFWGGDEIIVLFHPAHARVLEIE